MLQRTRHCCKSCLCSCIRRPRSTHDSESQRSQAAYATLESQRPASPAAYGSTGVEAAAAPPAATYQLSVLLFNVWCLPGALSDGHSLKRAQLISPLLDAYDVVILNEAFHHKHHLTRHCSHTHTCSLGANRTWRTLFGSGVIILSKRPIVQAHWQEYEQRARWDRFAAKGMLHCRLQLGQWQGHCLDVVATHMQAGHSSSEQAARQHQAAQLAEFVRTHCSAGSTDAAAAQLLQQQVEWQKGDAVMQQPRMQQGLRPGPSSTAALQELQMKSLTSAPQSINTPEQGAKQRQQKLASPAQPQQPCSSGGAARQPGVSFPVVLAGDLNMGPRACQHGSGSHSVHYADAADAAARHAAYSALRTGAGLCDCVAEACPDDINRFLLSPGPWQEAGQTPGSCADDMHIGSIKSGDGQACSSTLCSSTGGTCMSGGSITKAVVTYERLVGPEGQALSDSEAVVCRLEVAFGSSSAVSTAACDGD